MACQSCQIPQHNGRNGTTSWYNDTGSRQQTAVYNLVSKNIWTSSFYLGGQTSPDCPTVQ